jgi:hypothetical protein
VKQLTARSRAAAAQKELLSRPIQLNARAISMSPPIHHEVAKRAMRTPGDSAFLDFVHLVVSGDIDAIARHLAASPALATASSAVGATRHEASTFFFPEIDHYLYAGDTALHMAAAAFRRPVAELLVAHKADSRKKNRRGAEPLHYAANANRWNPKTRLKRSTISRRLAQGRTPSMPAEQHPSSGAHTIVIGRPGATRVWGQSEAAEQERVHAVAPCGPDHWAR